MNSIPIGERQIWEYSEKMVDMHGNEHYNVILFKPNDVKIVTEDFFDDLIDFIKNYEFISFVQTFYRNYQITEIQFPREFPFENVIDFSYMFYDCENLETVRLPDKFCLSQAYSTDNMFGRCPSLKNIGFNEVDSAYFDFCDSFAKSYVEISLDNPIIVLLFIIAVFICVFIGVHLDHYM